MDNILREEFRMIRETNLVTGETSLRVIPVNPEQVRRRINVNPFESALLNRTRHAPETVTNLFYDMFVSSLNSYNPLQEVPAPISVTDDYQNLLEQLTRNLSTQNFSNIGDPVYITLTQVQFDALERKLISTVSFGEAEQCSICQHDYILGEETVVSPCEHHFHTACAKEWFTVFSSKCPICRHDLRESA
jgi:hypothetical protein